jgi:hypothetical protein
VTTAAAAPKMRGVTRSRWIGMSSEENPTTSRGTVSKIGITTTAGAMSGAAR